MREHVAPHPRNTNTHAAPLTLVLGELKSGKELWSMPVIAALWTFAVGLLLLMLFGRVPPERGIPLSVLLMFPMAYLARPHFELVRVSHGPLGWCRVPPLPTSVVRETWRLRWNPFLEEWHRVSGHP